MCFGGRRNKSLSKCEKLSSVTMLSKLLWTIREPLRIDIVHSAILVTSLWTVYSVCLSVCLSQRTFIPVIHRIAQLNVMLKYIFEVPCISRLRYCHFRYYWFEKCYLIAFIACLPTNNVSSTTFMTVLWSRIGG
jgi:hypothetical protein